MRVQVIKDPKDNWYRIETKSGWFSKWKYYAARFNEQEAIEVATLVKHPNITEIK